MKLRNQTMWTSLGVGTICGLSGAVILCLLGSILISKQLIPQEYDYLISAAGILVWYLISALLTIRFSKLKKWFCVVVTGGTILLLAMVGNLLLPQPDLDLMWPQLLMVLCCGVLILLLGGRNRKTYRIR